MWFTCTRIGLPSRSRTITLALLACLGPKLLVWASPAPPSPSEETLRCSPALIVLLDCRLNEPCVSKNKCTGPRRGPKAQLCPGTSTADSTSWAGHKAGSFALSTGLEFSSSPKVDGFLNTCLPNPRIYHTRCPEWFTEGPPCEKSIAHPAAVCLLAELRDRAHRPETPGRVCRY